MRDDQYRGRQPSSSLTGAIVGAGALALAFLARPDTESTTVSTFDELQDVSGGEDVYFFDTDGGRISSVDAEFEINDGNEVVVVEDDPFEESPPTETYYHAAERAVDLEIRSDGIFPADAPECPDGGVHIASTVEGAREWAQTLANEGESLHFVEWDIYEVEVPESIEVVEDVFAGPGPDDAYIACTDFGIPPRFVTLYERLE